MNDRWFHHDQELWVNEHRGSEIFYEIGANYGSPDNLRQQSVAITVTAAHCAPILGDRDMAKRVVFAVFCDQSSCARDLDDDPTHSPAEIGWESVEPTHPTFTAKWTRTLLAPGLDDLDRWIESVRASLRKGGRRAVQ